MRIAQVSPLFESVPPKLYGGTERIVSYLTEELVHQGHEVTLFASGDSQTKARLLSPWCCSLRLRPDVRDPFAHHIKMLEMVEKESDGFDIIHYHTDYIHFPFARRSIAANLTTIHNRLDKDDIQPVYGEYKELSLVSISNSQRFPLPEVNWRRTIYHGLPKDLYKFYESNGQYLAFIGRFSPEKGVDKAIDLALSSDMPLKIAAKIEVLDLDYYENKIKPLLDLPIVDYIGEIGEKDKNEFLGNALALLFLIDWPEPFGLVMIEAMACGTPVIAWKNGSVPEIIEDGVTGFIVSSMEEAREALKNIHTIDRKKVRKRFEERFTSTKMVEQYLDLYEELIDVRRLSGFNSFVSPGIL